MDSDRKGNGIDRRQALECMAWGGTGLVWTLTGGVPGAKLISEAQAAASGFSFVQISDSHIGFDKPANPNALGTLEEAIAKIGALLDEARLHDSYRRHHSSLQTAAIRRRRANDRARQARRALRSGRTRHHRRKQRPSLSRSLRQGSPRAKAGIPSTMAACISSASSMSSI